MAKRKLEKQCTSDSPSLRLLQSVCNVCFCNFTFRSLTVPKIKTIWKCLVFLLTFIFVIYNYSCPKHAVLITSRLWKKMDHLTSTLQNSLFCNNFFILMLSLCYATWLSRTLFLAQFFIISLNCLEGDERIAQKIKPLLF